MNFASLRLRPEATEGRKRLLDLHLDYITEAKEDASH